MSTTADKQGTEEQVGVKVEAPAKPKPRGRGKSTGKASTSGKAKSTGKAKASGTGSRTKFPTYKSEAAAEKVMKANEKAYREYQVERDKNRNEKGMAKHREGYRTYKNAYTQLLALRKAAGKGRRNAKAS